MLLAEVGILDPPDATDHPSSSTLDLNFLIQSIVAMLVITAPPDPAKVLLFNAIVDDQKISRGTAAMRVALIVAFVLGISALGGMKLASAMGIDLNAFSVVGGIVVAAMGFEMLYGGKPSRTQGETDEEPNPADGLVMPLAIPLIAGPGSIVTCVSISSSNSDGPSAALISSLCVALCCFLSFRYLGNALAKVSEQTTALLLRLGGMLLATIGTQMLLGGLKKFFE